MSIQQHQNPLLGYYILSKGATVPKPILSNNIPSFSEPKFGKQAPLNRLQLFAFLASFLGGLLPLVIGISGLQDKGSSFKELGTCHRIEYEHSASESDSKAQLDEFRESFDKCYAQLEAVGPHKLGIKPSEVIDQALKEGKLSLEALQAELEELKNAFMQGKRITDVRAAYAKMMDKLVFSYLPEEKQAQARQNLDAFFRNESLDEDNWYAIYRAMLWGGAGALVGVPALAGAGGLMLRRRKAPQE